MCMSWIKLKIQNHIDIYDFISGESMDPDAMICMCEYKDIDGKGEKPVLMFFKHGLEEEKC